MIKKFNQAFSAILAACVILTSVPVNALSTGETNTVGAEHTLTEQQTLNDLNTENSISTNESNATTAEVATDSNASEDTSISKISSNDIDSSEGKLNNEISLQSDNTEDEEEPSTDNWELSTVFYDSTVNNGKTPLTEIDWDASDGGYGEGTPRVITVQINYKNTNAVTTYQPGELKLKIDGLLKDASIGQYTNSSTQYLNDFNVSWIIGANDATHTGYDWKYSAQYVSQQTYGGTPYINIKNITFTNTVSIEEKTNFEGSIQMVYTITPKSEYPEAYKDECIRSLRTDLQATLNDNITSNIAHFEYTRTYTHPWEYNTYSARKIASKINSYDGLGSNAANYIWVKWNLGYTSPSSSNVYPYIFAKDMILKDAIPDECIVLDEDGDKLEAEDGVYNMPINSSWTATKYIYVGYPKSIYKDDNLSITNTVELWGRYDDKTEIEFLSQATANINLADFEFSYSGELYGINKKWNNDYYEEKMYYQEIINEGTLNSSNWLLQSHAIYTGNPMTLKIGDDLLYCTDANGDYVKLKDNEYYFTCIYFSNSSFYNGNGNQIPKGKYNCELWVRYKDTKEYVLYEDFQNGYGGKKYSENDKGSGFWYFSKEEGIVGFYFVIHDMTESLKANDTYNQLIKPQIAFIKKDIPESGRLYNFDYLQVFFKDDNGNLVLQNEPTSNSYNNFITKNEIADFDKSNYGTYMQRDCDSKPWGYRSASDFTPTLKSEKSFGTIKQDAQNEKFNGSCTLTAKFDVSRSSKVYLNYLKDYDPEYGIKGIRFYDLLPIGMELVSTKEEIIKNTFFKQNYNVNIYNTNGQKVNMKDVIKNTDIVVTSNWKNTGRTKIEIIVNFNEPIYLSYSSGYGSGQSAYITILTNFDYSISYDSFLEYGSVWMNYCYVDKIETQEKGINVSGITDNGYYDKDALDINENGDTTERLAYAKATSTITSVISTHQDVTKYVQTDKSNYSTGTVKASPDSEYTYKLRARTGSANVTNFIIYDSIEEYVQDPYSTEQSFITAYGDKNHWNGEFLGVDTSYAESKGYKVKVWYSENMEAGNLYNEDGSLYTDWKEYSDSIDKSKVKSLAFEYLDKDDVTQKAILPANSQTYVLVKMQAPPEENRKVLAYNGCRTQWQALDDYDRPVDFITGINSNIVKVSLSDYYDITVNKTWDDENNKWGLRPDSVDIILKKDGTEVERKQITKDNLSVTFTDLLVEDSDRFTIEEAPLSLYSSSIEYNDLEDCYEVTNTLKDDAFTDISGTKIWIGDKETNRPESITIKLLKDGEVYRTTTTNANKEWKYIFPKVPIYNADETKCVYSVEEVPIERYSVQYTTPSKGLAIKFNSQFRTESVSYDYVEIYYKKDGQTYKLGKWGGTDLAGKTVNVPTSDFYLYWRTDGSQCSYYGFSIDSIESAEVSATGTVATLPNYTATELTGNEYPESPNHGNYGNNVNMLWYYTGNFMSDVPAEGLFNIVNTYKGIDAINLSFVKAIEGTDESWNNMKLDKNALYKFQVSMKNTETGDTISVQIDNKNTVTVREVPIGTYVITEKDDMYFDFISMQALNSVEGITFEKVDSDYILTITEDAAEEMLQIKVNNKIEPDRPYEDKEEKENLFKYPSSEEEPSLLSRIANFFKN